MGPNLGEQLNDEPKEKGMNKEGHVFWDGKFIKTEDLKKQMEEGGEVVSKEPLDGTDVSGKTKEGHIFWDEKLVKKEEIEKQLNRGDKEVEDKIINCLTVDHVDEALELQKEHGISQDFMEKAVEGEMSSRLVHGLVNGFNALKERFDVSQEVADKIINEEVSAGFSQGCFSHVDSLLEKLDMERDEKFLADFGDSIKEGICSLIARGDINEGARMLRKYGIDDAYLRGEEARVAAVMGVASLLELGNNNSAYELVMIFQLSGEELKGVIERQAEIYNKKGFPQMADELMGRFGMIKGVADTDISDN